MATRIVEAQHRAPHPWPRQRQVLLRQFLGHHQTVQLPNGLQLPLWWPWAAASSPPPFDGLLLPLSSSASVGPRVFLFFTIFRYFSCDFRFGSCTQSFQKFLFGSVEPHIHEPVVQVSSRSMKF